VWVQESVEGLVQESQPHASTVFRSIRNAGVADVPLDALLLTTRRCLMIGFISLGLTNAERHNSLAADPGGEAAIGTCASAQYIT
jgi:hypothetical protein